jgi:hypothetical protein
LVRTTRSEALERQTEDERADRPHAPAVARVLALQKSAGNAAVARLLGAQEKQDAPRSPQPHPELIDFHAAVAAERSDAESETAGPETATADASATTTADGPEAEAHEATATADAPEAASTNATAATNAPAATTGDMPAAAATDAPATMTADAPGAAATNAPAMATAEPRGAAATNAPATAASVPVATPDAGTAAAAAAADRAAPADMVVAPPPSLEPAAPGTERSPAPVRGETAFSADLHPSVDAVRAAAEAAVVQIDARVAALTARQRGRAADARGALAESFSAQRAAIGAAHENAAAQTAADAATHRASVDAATQAASARIDGAHQAAQQGGLDAIEASRAQGRAAADTQSARAVAESERCAAGFEPAPAATGEPDLAQAQERASSQISGRVREQCVQTGAQAAGRIDQTAAEFEATAHAPMLDAFQSQIGQAAADTSTHLTAAATGAHGQIDAIAAHGATAAEQAAQQALTQLGLQEAAAAQEIDRWEEQAIEAIVVAAQRLRAPLLSQAAEAASELETCDDEEAVAEGVQQTVAAIDRAGSDATAELDEASAGMTAGLDELTGARRTAAGEGTEQVAAAISQAHADTGSAMQQAAGRHGEAAAQGAQDVETRLGEAHGQFATQTQASTAQMESAVTRVADEAGAGQEALVADGHARAASTSQELADRYTALKAEADQRSAQATQAEGGVLDRAVEAIGGVLASVRNWFKSTFGDFFGGLMYGILAGLAIVVGAYWGLLLVGASLVMAGASAGAAAAVVAVIAVVGALALSINNRFSEYYADNKGKDAGFLVGTALVLLGILDLTGLPYILEGAFGWRMFGKRLEGFERWERLGLGLVFFGTFLLMLKALLRGRALLERPPVKEPLPDPKGDYEGIPLAKEVTGYQFEETMQLKDGVQSFRTEVTAPDGSGGWVQRGVELGTGEVVFLNAFLDTIPKPLRSIEINGTKMALVDYITLRQMRMLGVRYGGFQTVKMSTIQNLLTIVQVKAGKPLMESFSVSYAKRSIEAGGKRIVKAEMDTYDMYETPIDKMLEHFETNGVPGGPRDAAKVKANDELLAKHGFTRDTTMKWNFDINLTLEPIGATAPPPAPAPPVSPAVPPPPPVPAP